MTKERMIEELKHLRHSMLIKAKYRQDIQNLLTEVIEVLEKDRPKGKWEITQGGNYLCNNCYTVSEREYDFCPNCGADMRESEIEE